VQTVQRKIRFGMVGGGEGAFIGAVHRAAARLDNQLELVCGTFSSVPERGARTAESLGLGASRNYSDYRAMFAAEAALPPGERMEFVAIVTPNYLHFPIAMAALQRGFHVLSDKPATISLAECRELKTQVETSGRLYGLTHPYTSYPMVVEARERVAAAQLGTIRKIIVEYTQGWLADSIERAGNAQAAWRLDPEKAGPSCCIGDIGVHAFNLVEFVTGLQVTEICSDLNRIVRGRLLDDDGTVLLRFNNGAHGVLVASQVCIGEENDLTLRIYGDAAGISWRQQEPNSLWLKHPNKPAELVRDGTTNLSTAARYYSRLPAGHPEGYLEAFANVYRNFAAQIRGFSAGAASRGAIAFVPGIADALRGMAFIETAVAASGSPQKWHALPEVA
jgi:predicted dehydrogenase